MLGLLEADSGSIEIGPINIREARIEEKHRLFDEVGMVFQSAALFDSLSVRENIGIRMIERERISAQAITHKVAWALEQVGLATTIMDKLPAELSGGMRKRVGIARAIVHNPTYLVYDEPTTGLDPVNSSLIDNLIKRLSQDPQKTSIIITHDMHTVRTVADKVAMLHEGQIVFHGRKADFFQADTAAVQRFLAREQAS